MVDQMNDELLSVEDLGVSYFRKNSGLCRENVKALQNVSLHVRCGSTLGVVGESGSGKTTLGRAIVKLTPIDSGSIYFEGKCISNLNGAEFLPYRKKIQMIFQDPFGALNPRMTVKEILQEPLDIHFGVLSEAEKRKRILELLEQVKLPQTCLERYPHSFSGGQRQRISIARALAVNPQLLICDEPVSALDVSIQAQIVNLLKDLQKEFGLTYLFISHDMAIVHYISDTVAVMHNGRVVEYGEVNEVYTHPKNEYTRLLLDSVPSF